MRKTKIFGLIVSVMVLWMIGQPMEAQAKEYIWTTANEVTGWYESETQGGEFTPMDEAPINITEEDSIRIGTTPTDEVKSFLEDLDIVVRSILIQIPEGESIVIGVENGNLSASIGVVSGTVVYNGYATSANITNTGNLTVNGDVGYLQLGSASLGMLSTTGTLDVNGNVERVSWYREKENVDVEGYDCFKGDCFVTGNVGAGEIVELFYDDVLDRDVFAKCGQIETCYTGAFIITSGSPSIMVPITEIEPNFGEYYYLYSYGNGLWIKQYYNKETKEYAGYDDVTQEDIPVGAHVLVGDTIDPIVFDIDLGHLTVCKGNVVLNGDLIEGETELYESGSLSLEPGVSGEHTVVINGDVPKLHLFYHSNPKANVTITGKVTDGSCWANSNKRTGYFSCENVQLIKDGVWNENVLIKKTLDDFGVAYEIIPEETVADAIGDATIGEEITVDATTIVKSVEATLEQTTQDKIENIRVQEEFVEVLEEIVEAFTTVETKEIEATPICAVDISIDTFYRDKNSGNIYTSNPTYGTTNISELPQGKSLEFTVKVPKNYYKSTSKYEVVRQHENGDGSVRMDRLQTSQSGDMLTFASDKFSTFVIVEVVEKEVTPQQPQQPQQPQEPQQSQQPEKPSKNKDKETVQESKSKVYVVVRGDNLSKIARKNGMTLSALLKLNPHIKNPNLIFAGQLINISINNNTNNVQEDLNAEYYVVERGDNLFKIAKKNKVNFAKLFSMNKEIFAQKYIYAGQKVRIK